MDKLGELWSPTLSFFKFRALAIIRTHQQHYCLIFSDWITIQFVSVKNVSREFVLSLQTNRTGNESWIIFHELLCQGIV